MTDFSKQVNQSLINQSPTSVVEAVERPHFLAEPVFVFVHRKNAFGLASDFAAQIGECQTRRFSPQPTKFVGTACHKSEQFFTKEWKNATRIKRLILKA
jgi:hypothetical protein